jgi:nucleotide-binding universal stress UspA family protein
MAESSGLDWMCVMTPPSESGTAGPTLFCFDGSEDSKQAIRVAAALLAGRRAVVLAVVQDARSLPPFAWVAPFSGIEALLADARAAGLRIAEEGAEVAAEAGLDATPLVVEATGPVWPAITAAADQHAASIIVLGSRGLGGVSSALLGSVSTGVLHHADRPTLIVRHPDDGPTG